MKFLNKSILIAILLMGNSTYFKAMNIDSIAWGLSERQGVRPTMEDAYVHESLELVPGKPKAHYFGIFDGHAGSQSANYAGEHAANEFRDAYLNIEEATNPLMQGVYTHQKEHEENPLKQGISLASQPILIEDALTQSYIDLDKKMQQQFQDGTAAVSAVIDDGKLYLGWAGDSRAVVADANGTIKAATVDHKPNLPSEENRMKLAGGIVVFMGNAWRINGLAMSRSLGDNMTKKAIKPNIIIPNPELITLDNLQKGDIIILACDGIWDVMSNLEAVQFVQENLEKPLEELKAIKDIQLMHIQGKVDQFEKALNKKNDGNNEKLMEIARLLRDKALIKGSKDNISVMLIQVQ